jgi:acetyltransferase-like isoleucine patch superfamily enzyme
MNDINEKPIMHKYFSSIDYLIKGVLGYIAYITIAPPWLSAWIHKKRGVKIQDYKTVYIAPNVVIDTSFPENVTIGNYVYITRGAKIICHTAFTPLTQKIVGVEYTVEDIVIEEGAYIGVNAVIMPSVRVGRCAIVGSGAVVTSDVPDYAIFAGVPARNTGDVRELFGRSKKKSIK